MSIADILDHSAAVDGSIRITGNIGHTQVNPKHVGSLLELGFLNFTRYQQIPVAPMELQITLALACLKQGALALTTYEWDSLPPIQCLDRDRRVGQGEREDAIIVSNRGERTKRTPGLLVELVGVTDFRKRPHNHLGRQAERLAHVLIAQLLKRKLAESARFPRDVADGVARGIGRFKRALKRISLFKRRMQLQLWNQFHTSDSSTNERLMQPERSAAFPRAAKAGGFLPPFL
jgi:hypothetical protein